MKLQKVAVAGTLESSDIMVTIEPVPGDGIEIQLTSPVEKQFGERIRQVITATLEQMEVTGVCVTAVDKGALDCTIRARVRTAACRGAGQVQYPWGGRRV